MIWSIDGAEWDYPCDIERISDVTLSDISGQLLDKNFFADVQGTFLRYTVTLAIPIGAEDDYEKIYELITEPVDGHLFVLPYNNSTITITGRVDNIKDVYRRMPDGYPHWVGIEFGIIANHPTKTMTLEETLARGMTPLPTFVHVPEGTTAIFSGGEWEYQTYDDADDNAY